MMSGFNIDVDVGQLTPSSWSWDAKCDITWEDIRGTLKTRHKKKKKHTNTAVHATKCKSLCLISNVRWNVGFVFNPG